MLPSLLADGAAPKTGSSLPRRAASRGCAAQGPATVAAAARASTRRRGGNRGVAIVGSSSAVGFRDLAVDGREGTGRCRRGVIGIAQSETRVCTDDFGAVGPDPALPLTPRPLAAPSSPSAGACP